MKWNTPNSYSKNYSPLLDSPGIYLIVSTNFPLGQLPVWKIQYVGMSQNIKKRMRNHPILNACKNRFGYVQIYFKTYRTKLREKEKFLIQVFSPPYNLQHRTKGI